MIRWKSTETQIRSDAAVRRRNVSIQLWYIEPELVSRYQYSALKCFDKWDTRHHMRTNRISVSKDYVNIGRYVVSSKMNNRFAAISFFRFPLPWVLGHQETTAAGLCVEIHVVFDLSGAPSSQDTENAFAVVVQYHADGLSWPTLENASSTTCQFV